MTIPTYYGCGALYTAYQEPAIIGELPPLTPGKLSIDSGLTVTIYDWVYWDTVTSGWKKVRANTTLTGKIVALVKELYDVLQGNGYKTSVSVDAAAFQNAVLIASGADFQIACGDTYVADNAGTARVAFDPATHTGLAGLLRIFKVQSADSAGVDYFSF